MGIVFYYAPMSSATRVHWALEELGLQYEKVKIDLSAGEQRTPAFRKINPNGKVPAMIIDGVPLFESLAMMLYLGETYGVDKGLFPPPGPARIEAWKWMTWAAVTMSETLTRYLRNTSERWPAEQRNARTGEVAKEELLGLLKILDDSLQGRQYLLGDQFSLADCSMAGMVPFMARLGIDVSQFSNVNTWAGRCVARPAMGRVMAG